MPSIKNLKKASQRILKAARDKENIILYGDSDLDGISSIVILKEAINTLGGDISRVYFPDREKEGYGINEKALNVLKEHSPALFITADLGIGNIEEVKIAKNLGFEVIIIDHHEVVGKIPSASIVVDPKQKGDKSFKKLATAGIVFKLAETLLKDRFSAGLEKSFLELTALATIADMMPEIEENEIFIYEGLKNIEKTVRPGLKAFFAMKSIKAQGSTRQMAQKIISALNAGERIDHSNETYELLISSAPEKAKDLASQLLEKSYQRQLKIKEIAQEIGQRISGKLEDLIVFEGDKSWPFTFTGAVASRVCREHQKPTFLFKKNDGKSLGSVRVPEGINSVEAMKSCENLLIGYGGHPPASGFRIKNENLEKFKECLIEYFLRKP